MTRRIAGKSHKPRICAFCSHPIAEKQPVFLVATAAGEIQGPYHAGCAERLSLQYKHTAVEAKTLGGKLYGQLPLPKGEGVEW